MSEDGTDTMAPGAIRALTTAELAEDAFLKAEHVRMLGMMNLPTDFEERKKAFVELALAQEAAAKAQHALRARTAGAS